MPTPEVPRPPEVGMARALNKSGPGQQMGRMTGLSPIPRRSNTRTHRAAPPGAHEDLGFIRVDGGAYVGTTLLSGVNEIAPTSETNALTDTGAATYNPSNGLFQVQRAGLWVVMADVRTDTQPDGYLHLQPGRDGFAESGPNQPFIYDGSEIIAAGVTAPGVGFVGSYWGARVQLATSGPEVTSAYVVLYPIAFFA